MQTNIESLPDEIIMIIISYSGDTFDTLRTYLGLNKRFDQMLLDKRLHLLTDFLHMNVRHKNFDYYYDSQVFQEVSEELISMRHSITDERLRYCFQKLIVFHLRQQYTDMGEEFRSTVENIRNVRKCFTDEQLSEVNRELKQIFNALLSRSLSSADIKQIECLILQRGARLNCRDHYIGEDLNLTKAFNRLLSAHIDNARSIHRTRLNMLVRFFKLLIQSNPTILNNRADVGCGGCTIIYFLFLTIYQLQCIHYLTSNISLNMDCYRAVIDLALYIFHCSKQVVVECDWCDLTVLDMLSKLVHSKTYLHVGDVLFVETSQLEILKMIFSESIRRSTVNEAFLLDIIERTMKNLIKENRLDLILELCYHYQCVQNIVNDPDKNRILIDQMTGNQAGRKMLMILMEKQIFVSWFMDKHLIFELLQKKERQLLEKLLILSPHLIAQLDNDGNNLLLQLCLKVRGCRHKIVELLLRMGCDLEHHNLKGETFRDVIQLSRNQKLLKTLVQREVIKFEIEVIKC